MDYLVIKSALINLAIYLILQLVIFRFIEKKRVFNWLVYVYFISLFYASIVWLIYFPLTAVFFISLLLSSLMIMIYVLAVFGVCTTSLRISLLSLIAGQQTGISLKEILHNYNREKIIEKRLERFLASGQIDYRTGYYRKTGKFSFFVIPASIFRLMWVLYGRKGEHPLEQGMTPRL